MIERDQAKFDQLIELAGPKLADAVDVFKARAHAIVNDAAKRLFGVELTSAEREFVMSGALIGPAVAAAVASGATHDGFVALVDKLFKDCKAQNEQN